MHNGFRPKSNVDQMCLSSGEDGTGLIGVKDIVETAILGLTYHVRNSKEGLFIAARTIKEDEDTETPNEYKKRKKNKRKTQWAQKQLYGQFIRQTMCEASKDWWGWLRKNKKNN